MSARTKTVKIHSEILKKVSDVVKTRQIAGEEKLTIAEWIEQAIIEELKKKRY